MAVVIDRMRGKIEAEGVALGGHALSERPLGVARQANRGDAGARFAAEQAVLAAFAGIGGAGGMGENCLGGGEYRGAFRR
jgi:hypothetical protein